MEKRINEDYIGVVRKINNGQGLEYIQVDIPKKFSNLSSKLRDMDKNANRTVFDLQTEFARTIPREGSSLHFDYCISRSYTSAYINGIPYPSVLTYNEYQEQIRNIEKSYKLSFDFKLDPEGTKRYIEKAICEYKKRIKSKFCIEAARYIIAYQYNLALESLKKDNNNKMFSSENIGWTVYEYPINNDLIFTVRSNFGYGSSAYFYVNLKYKGIDILPYSDVVKYYYANMQAFIRYTRLYVPARSSWDIALSFVVETANEAIADEAEFIKKWIMNEVEEMISGLNRLESDPTAYYKNIIGINQQTRNLVCVRNVLQDEIQKYKIYPEESIIAFQAEKISGALLLLDNLSTLTTIYPNVTKSIEQIKDMNRGLLPNFRSTKNKIEIEVERRREVVNKLEEQVEELTERNKPHEEAIKLLVEQAKKDNPSHTNIQRDYESKHPDYVITSKKIKDIRNDIYEKKQDIYQRNEFARCISECISRIEQYMTNVA